MSQRNNYSTSFVLGTTFGILGLSFFILGLIFLLIRGGNIGGDEFIVLGIVFTISGAVFLIVGGISFAVYFTEKGRVERLKLSGDSYDAEITNIYPNTYSSYGYTGSSNIFECIYRNSDNKVIAVKSKSILTSKTVDKFKAKVYVNPHDPRDYYVEVLPDLGTNSQNVNIDYDFR